MKDNRIPINAPRTLGQRICRIARIPFALGLATLLSSAVFAAVTPVVVFRSGPGSAYQLYVPSTKVTMTLAGTQKMNNVVIGDVDGDGYENDMVYTNASAGRLGYYKIPGDGVWTAANDHAIPNTQVDAVPLTVMRTGGVGTAGKIIYVSKSSAKSWRINPDGTLRASSVWMDKAFAVDARQRGFKSDLLWWTNGVGMRWRSGPAGTDSFAPGADWVPVGGGKLDGSLPTQVMLFHTSDDIVPTLYLADRYWNISKVMDTNWPWTMNAGSTVTGDVDSDGLAEIVTCKSATDPLQWYSVPANEAPFDPTALITTNIYCGWNLAGVAMVDVKGGTTPPPPSGAVSVSRISDLKNYSDGTVVQIAGKSRTKLVKTLSSSATITQTGYYLEESDRSAGIRVVGSTSSAEGQLLTVTGTLGTLNGERVVTATTQTTSTTIMKIAPTSTTIKALFGTVAMTGLLVQVQGTISSASTSAGTFMLTDGTQPVKVYCADNKATSGTFTVTGCVGVDTGSTGSATPVLRMESSADMSGSGTTPPPPAPVINVKYSLWSASPLVKVYKTDATQTLGATAIKAAKNEHEAFQLVLRGGSTSVSSIAVKASDLVGPSTIPASNISLSMVRYVNLPDFGLDLPDALPPYTGAFNLAVGQTQPIWIDVYVPKTATAGDYTGTITLTDAGGGRADVPYTLHVYSFSLPDDWKLQTAFGLWDDQIAQQHNEVGHSTAHIQTTINYYDFMLSRGISAVTMPYGIDLGTAEGTTYLTDPRMSSFNLPSYSSISWMTGILSKIDSLGVMNKAYQYTYDEPYVQSQFDEVKASANELHSMNSKAKSMITFSEFPQQDTEPSWTSGRSYAAGAVVGHVGVGLYNTNYLFRCKAAHTSSSSTEPSTGSNWKTYWEQLTHMDMLNGYVNIWCVGARSYYLFKDKLAQRISAGETVWTYNWFGPARLDDNPKHIDPTIETRLQAWMSYLNGVTGMLWWCSDYWQDCPNPWTNISNAPWAVGEGILYYPGYQVGLNTGVSSIRMEAVRDGLEDYQYLWLYQQKYGRAAALSFVGQLVTDYSTFSTDNTKFASIRDQIAQQLGP